MPMIDDNLENIIHEARKKIKAFFGIEPTARVMVATKKELVSRTYRELEHLDFFLDEKDKMMFTLNHFLVGKFFKKTNEVWVLSDLGTNLGTIVHELLHSIQICHPHREPITSYLSYYITKSPAEIQIEKLKDWEEICKSVGIDEIKKRFLHSGDCEIF